MKKFFLIIAIHLIVTLANAQTETVSNHSVSLHLISTTYNYEHPLSKKMTITGSVGLAIPYWAWHISSNGWAYAINPVLGLEPRFYYNMDKRNSKGKNTNYNSANYLSLDCYYMFKSVANKNTSRLSGMIISPNWGIRRVYNGRWLLDFSLGIWCFQGSAEYFLGSESRFSWAPRINLKFGVVF
ncbi:MAG: hypothetical protein FWH23_05285 [Bacteroidales bacterium]|nr:hypothetical protein [Bacteroidales bacterium]MCL2133190.1 hypothetical protein [Bacteroidales bacterium]